LTNRLTPAATDRLPIMYGILLRHLFLCCRRCVPWSCDFDTADVNIFLLGNNRPLISSDRYFETVAKSYMAFRCTYSVRMVIFEHVYFTR